MRCPAADALSAYRRAEDFNRRASGDRHSNNGVDEGFQRLILSRILHIFVE
jgi:hypothetical protein